MNKTAIPWTDFTWTVSRGCSPISPGCDHCYAAAIANRFAGPKGIYNGLAVDGKWTGKVRLCPENLDQPLKKKKPSRIFVNSMSDLFHRQIDPSYLDRVFGAMWACLYSTNADGRPGHIFQLLTKRPATAEHYIRTTQPDIWARHSGNMFDEGKLIDAQTLLDASKGPHPRIWCGTTVENQEQFERRVSALARTPAAVRFISIEPMLEQIDISYLPVNQSFDGGGGPVGGKRLIHYIDWVIVGCESGPGHRPCDLDWIRDIRDQCLDARIPLFIKQARIDGELVKMPEIDGVVYDQYPEERKPIRGL